MSRVFASAEQVAFGRALSALDPDAHLRNPDYMARHLIGAQWRSRLRPHWYYRRKMEEMLPGSYGFHIARTKFGDHFTINFLMSGGAQVVVLGAGLDSRALRFGWRFPAACFFELDAPANQDEKLNRLKELNVARGRRVTFVPCDLTRQPALEALSAHGFDTRQRTLFIVEGLSYYLEESHLRAVMEKLVGQMNSASALIMDYATDVFVGGDLSATGAASTSAWLSRIKEPFKFGSSPQKLSMFLSTCGLRVQADLGPEELQRVYLSTADGKLRYLANGVYRLAYAESPGPSKHGDMV